MQEKVRLHQFLMGQDNSRFGTTRSNLLSRQTELNLDSVYSQIIQEERHLNVMRGSDERTPVVGFAAATKSSSQQPSSQINGQAAATRFGKSPTVCSHCGKQGHEASNYFQVIGFPDWWENNKTTGGRGGDKISRGRGFDKKGRGRGGRGSGFRAYNTQLGESSSSSAGAPPGMPNFSKEQWESIAQFFNTQQSAPSETQSGKKEQLFIYGKDRRYDIIIDSEASHHMTGDLRLLTDIQTIALCPIEMPNGQIAWVTSHAI